MNNKQINNIVSFGIVDTKGLYIFDTRPSVKSPIAGCKAFLGEMLGPFSEKVIMSIVKEGSKDSIIIHIRMNQFGRCRIGSEIFGSKISSYHVKSSFITAKFIMIDNDVDVYPS
ncbi:hypothetical protein RhiirA4_453469 [Rhizophagus irregularis]|uniref:Uncharacterized protein n=1 Tax=Rhizophagus irregularis TaxID=588596 RepID=A0A2I1G0M9_9GLOM|nr:hypothetical protein RhiirA4_453469 [Rhizophagus irregularis]